MSQILLDIPDDSLAALKLSPEDAGDTLRLAAAIKLFELNRLSSGAAARLAGLLRTVFLTKLADFGVATFRHTPDDLDGEVRFA